MKCTKNSREFLEVAFNIMLNVLGLYIAKKTNKDFNSNVIKQEKLLNLKPEDINNHIKDVCAGLDRALFFFQTRCGIRKIADVNYKAQIAVVAYFFADENLFKQKEIHDFFEFWYWTSIFSWMYPSNQNVNIINEIPKFEKIFDKTDSTRLCELEGIEKNKLLNIADYSDCATLTMSLDDHTKKRKTAQPIMTKSICQFYMANDDGYYDFQDNDVKINSLLTSDKKLDIHHIIPLGSAKKLGQTTSELRKDVQNPLNSPLNMVYITREANKQILDMDYQKYSNDKAISSRITKLDYDEIDGTIFDNGKMDEAKINKFLNSRFKNFERKLKDRLKDLKNSIENEFNQ